MKVFIAELDLHRTGGGWSFMNNFYKGMGELITRDLYEADIYFICSPSMVNRDQVLHAMEHGKKIVLRVDNAVRNSRNRNTGMTRMKDFADWASLVIYQSQWAKDYLEPFLGIKDSRVIVNGVDLSIYHPPSTFHLDYERNYIYSRFNRDETKNWEVARYWYSQESLKVPTANLFITGQFSDELQNGNFDFYQGETFRYLGVLNPQAMADLYRNSKYFLYTYFNDACSNSLIEALVSGCKIVGDKYYRKTGGAKEIFEAFKLNGKDYFSTERMCQEYAEALKEI